MEYVRSDDGFSQGVWEVAGQVGRLCMYVGTAHLYPGGAQSMHTVDIACM